MVRSCPLALTLVTVTALLAGACGTSPPGFAIVRADGSSTVYPLTEAVAEDFLRATPGARVTVGVAGTGGGFKKFCRREVEIASASRPISGSELEACAAAGVTFLEVPVAYDGVTVVVHPSNDWVTSLTVGELGRLWGHEAEGRVTRWSQLRAGFPDREIRLFGAGVDSGTFDYFTEAVTGTARDSRGDYTSSEDDNTLVQGVSGDRDALGFFGFAYYEENTTVLKAVPISPAAGAPPVGPSVETIRSGTYRPLSRPIFIYVRLEAFGRPDVRAFVDYYVTHGAALAREVGYVPLSERAAGVVRTRVAQAVTGSLYARTHLRGETLDHMLGLE